MMAILDIVDLSLFSLSLYVLAFGVVGGLICWRFILEKRLDLPYFYVDSSVVITLEEAHKKAGDILPRIRNSQLTIFSAQNLRLLFRYQEWN